jgi:4-amino-4-deoxy-L-arabinose transferase-like glycosyltransferase
MQTENRFLLSWLKKNERRLLILCGCAVFAVFVARQIQLNPQTWGQAKGYEYLWIAESIASGEGFSFSAYRRWMFQTDRDKPNMPDYAPTAWKEPVYPYILGASLNLLGDRKGRAAVVAIQVVALALTVVFTYLLGRRLVGPWVGMLAAALIAVPLAPAKLAVGTVNTAILGAMIVTGLLLLLLRCVEKPTVARAATLGVALGMGALTLSSTLMIGPSAAVVLLVESVRGRSLKPLAMAAVVAVVSALTIMPWTLRNAATFKMFIPIQTGLGVFANFSNAYLAETFMPELAMDPSGTPPPWKSRGPFDAVRKFSRGGRSSMLLNRSLESVAENPPEGWARMSEPERDQIHMAQFKRFVASYPAVFAKLMSAKALRLYLLMPKVPLIFNLAALAGLVIVMRRRLGYLLPLTIFLCTAPLLITAPLYYRYRFPVEPLIAILAASSVTVISGLWKRFGSSGPGASSESR